MLLRAIRSRLRPTDPEQGAVLIAVIGVAAVIMIITALIASSSVTATVYSSTVRAQLQARAAAEAGIDLVWASMEGGTFYCSRASAAGTGLEYEATMEYFDEAGDPITCSGTSTLSGTPATAVVTSTGTADAPGVGAATSGNERTVISFFDVVVNDNAALLDKVFFTDGGFTVTNSTKVLDPNGLTQADMYSNGTVTCNTTTYIQGSILTQNDFTATNNCNVAGDVWAGGAITIATQMNVVGDVMSAGGTGAVASPITLDKTWVGGTVVANGNVSLLSASGSTNCPLAGYDAKVCGSIVSVEGTITIENRAKTAGNVMARGNVNLGTTNSTLIVGGNVVSTTGGLLASNYGNSGSRVKGFVAVAGSSQLPKARMGNQVASCATGTTGLVVCNPAQPPIPLDGLPSLLNFPTNTRVVAPPRESLARVNSDSLSLATWIGWAVEDVTCANVKTRIRAGWTGKLLLRVTDCTAPIALSNTEVFQTPGDLAIINRSGFAATNSSDLKFVASAPSTATRTVMLIVPADAKLADGTTNLVNWTTPIASDPTYFKPVCASGAYGDIALQKLTNTNIKMFIYTPCQFSAGGEMHNFYGQIYAGDASYPNNGEMYYAPIDVPGAVTATALPPGPPVIATQTSRFDARG